MSALSRRSLVASAASLPALAVPAVAVAATIAPDRSIENHDPIFAAIEKYGRADEACSARFRYEDGLEDGHVDLTPAPDDHRTPALAAAVTAVVVARRELADTTPTTLAGLSAYLDFVVAETAKLSSDSYEEFFFADDGEIDETMPFVRSLARSARHIAGMASIAGV